MTSELLVRGRVARDAGPVRVRLETSDGSLVADAPVDPTGHGHGDWVPFETRFVISRPDRGVDERLFVVAVDAAGAVVSGTPRPYVSTVELRIPSPAGGG